MSEVTDEDRHVESLAEFIDELDGPFRLLDLPWRLHHECERVQTLLANLTDSGFLRVLDLQADWYWVRTDRPTDVTEPVRSVYFCWDADGCLLYIGCTVNLRQRIRQHAKSKPWWPQVAVVTETPVIGWQRSASYETQCIAEMEPRYNVYGTNGRVRPQRRLQAVSA